MYCKLQSCNTRICGHVLLLGDIFPTSQQSFSRSKFVHHVLVLVDQHSVSLTFFLIFPLNRGERVQTLLCNNDHVSPSLLSLEKIHNLCLFSKQSILPYVWKNVPNDAANTKNVVFADKSENIFEGFLVFHLCVVPAMIFGK